MDFTYLGISPLGSPFEIRSLGLCLPALSLKLLKNSHDADVPLFKFNHKVCDQLISACHFDWSCLKSSRLKLALELVHVLLIKFVKCFANVQLFLHLDQGLFDILKFC